MGPMRLLVARRAGHVKQLPPISNAAADLPVTAGRDPWMTKVRGLACRVVPVALTAAWAALMLAACGLRPAPFQRAALLAQRGQVGEGIQLLRDDLELHPTLHQERRLLIRLYGTVGNLDAARAQSERLAELLAPNSPVPSVELGHAYELAHRYEEALAAYDRAADVAPESALGPRWGGLRAARWGELGLAETRLEEALRRDRRDATVWHALGLVRLGLGKLQAARAAYAAGLAADPQAIENRLGLATVALRLQEPGAALAEYESLLAVRPAFSDALLGKSWSLILIGRWKSAEAALREAEARGADPGAIARQRVELQARERKPVPSSSCCTE
jgi:tetratricopeptide (TPR) repeat protein